MEVDRPVLTGAAKLEYLRGAWKDEDTPLPGGRLDFREN
jgi:hypothetical protein